MNRVDLSIATMTWARDHDEEKLLRESLQHLAKLKIPVFITDGGSNIGFLDFLRSFPNFILVESESRGVWPQVKNSLMAAYGAGREFIFYTEPDKGDFFHGSLPGMIDHLAVDDQAAILTVSRSAAGFASFPAFQRMTETTINNCCGEVIGDPGDFTYGPFLMNRQLVPYLETLKDNIGWGWRPYAFCRAHQLGYRIGTFTGDFSCPVEQREDTPKERIYRMRQLAENIEGILLAKR